MDRRFFIPMTSLGEQRFEDGRNVVLLHDFKDGRGRASSICAFQRAGDRCVLIRKYSEGQADLCRGKHDSGYTVLLINVLKTCRRQATNCRVFSRMFRIYLQHDGTCLLNIDGGADTRNFDDVLEAITAAREMSGTGKSPLTIYSTLGVVVFDSLV